MASDPPGSGDWASPSESSADRPAAPPAGPSGWPAAPPAAQPPWGQPQPGWGQPQYGWGPPQAPRPGIIPLRPLAVGETLDGAFTMIRRYPGATLGLTAPVMLVVEAFRVFASYVLLHGVSNLTTNADGSVNGLGDLASRTGTVEALVGVVTLIATSVLSGIIATIVGQGALGRPMHAGEAWRATRPAIWRLLGASLLIFLICIGIGAAAALPGIVVLIAGSLVGGVVLLVVGGLFAVVALLYVTVLLSLTTPALMLEKQRVWAALGRSRTLVRGSWWRVFGIVALAGIIAAVIGGIISAPFALAGGGLSTLVSGNNSQQFNFFPLLLAGIGGLIGSTLVRPFSAGVVALLYLDRRMRAEGLDQTLQQAAAKPTA